MKITIFRRNDVSSSGADERAIYRLRYLMFKERLNWEVETDNEMEFDEFDRLDPLYLIAKQDSYLFGCWRMLPSTGPNMLRDIFPELLAGSAAPCSEDIWELSRFAVCKQKTSTFGLSTLPLQMMLHAVQFARLQNVRQFVTVTTVAMERLLIHAGLAPQRLGPVLKIGVERTLALSFNTDESTETALRNALLARGHAMDNVRSCSLSFDQTLHRPLMWSSGDDYFDQWGRQRMEDGASLLDRALNKSGQAGARGKRASGQDGVLHRRRTKRKDDGSGTAKRV